MSKLNVNVATREELVEKAGLRPDVADAILEFRGKHGGKITDVEALDELRGVGPATFEQLRSVLDFRDKGEKAGNGNGRAVEEGQKDARETAVKTAQVASSTVRVGAEAARSAAEAGAQATTTATRGGLQLVQRTADAFGEAQRETARQSAEGTAELGRLFVEMLNEQTRHNLEVASTFGRAVNWGEVLRAQSEFVRESLERMNQLNSRYLEIVRTVMQVPVSAAERQARKSA